MNINEATTHGKQEAVGVQVELIVINLKRWIMSNITRVCSMVYMDSKHYRGNDGLSKREYFATSAMQGLIANSFSDGTNQSLSFASAKEIADMAVNYADELIESLNL